MTQPTSLRPGTPEKVEVLAARYAEGSQSLFHPEDVNRLSELNDTHKRQTKYHNEYEDRTRSRDFDGF